MKIRITILLLLLFFLFGCTMKKKQIDINQDDKNDSLELIEDRISSFHHFSELEQATAEYEIKNGNFESGNLTNWYSEEESKTFEVTASNVDIWNNSVRKEGNFYLGYGKDNYDA